MARKRRVSYRTRVVHHTRRIGSRVKARAKKAKPSLAILGGLSVGPIEAITGSGGALSGGNIWNVGGNKIEELWRRIQITYTGGYMGQGSRNYGNAHGSIAAIAGFGIHYIASITGANKYLARMKLPFRI